MQGDLIKIQHMKT